MTKLAVVCALAITTLQAQTPATPARASTARGEWPTYSGDLAGTKYSPLDQITRDNFSTLRIAWRTKSPDSLISVTMPGGGEWAGDPRVLFDELSQRDPDRWRDGQAPYVGNFKATPLMVNGVLYLNSPASVGAALDARTGAVQWVFNPKSYEAGTTTMSLRWNQRGVAYWTDGTEERVYWGTGDGYLIAVDAKSGRPVKQFGTNGRVDLMDGLPRATRGARDFLNALTYSVQSPPIVVGDLVVTPASISSLVNAKEQIPGWVRAFDARTGAVKWTFHTIPQKGEPGYDTWQGGSAEYSGKVSVWTVMSADESLGHLYLPTNTVAPDFYGGHRLGNNLYAESLVAVDIQTGKRVWHFQTVHHGLWDYDNPAAPNLIDLVVDGVAVKAVAQISKQGFIYTFNRVTGAPIWPIEERAVPASDVIGEHASRTQPFPTKPAPFEQQGVTVDQLVDFTPAIRAMAVEAVKPFRLGPIYTPPTLEGTITRPFTVGGGNWSGAAVDPETGMLYVPSRNGFGINRIAPPEPATNSNLRYIQTPGRSPQMPQGLPLLKPPYSRLTAIDMNRGEHAWMSAAGAGDRIRQHPLLRDLNLPPLGGDSTLSGPLLTKTLLIYALTTGGTGNGPRLVAYDKATGRELGSADLPGAAIGTPMTYLVAGKQYIALTVQGATPRELPELVALTLP
ncbi:MAG TPA: pyrroloquinoline quinone-dependent dehydrogenase [Vicinamibacterales bacterium]|nr:pyrroloquinoline quinone-dependent dehydrogenase [Vicinamibacterales bacterium]